MAFVKTQNDLIPCDVRSAYQRSHQIISPACLNHTTIYRENIEASSHLSTNHAMPYKCLSEQTHQFNNRNSSNYNTSYEMAAPHQNLHFANHLCRRANTLLPKPIKVYDSTYQNDFTKHHVKSEPSIDRNYSCKHPDAPTNKIDSSQPGFEKYLDIYATTNMLNYPYYNDDQRHGISKMDTITVWDWLNVPKAKGTKLNINIPLCSIDTTKRITLSGMSCDEVIENRPYPTARKHVPNKGLLSEQQEEYSYPVKTENEHQHVQIKQAKFYECNSIDSVSNRTEYSQYGSGRPIHATIPQN